ncbi:amidohydrolase family protein [Bowmanella denitrificans]|uniref:amidohydrolase family protein n=1 Tax=Bowmanella denitrificans TaxID=366582 RepID=UPI0031E0692F
MRPFFKPGRAKSATGIAGLLLITGLACFSLFAAAPTQLDSSHNPNIQDYLAFPSQSIALLDVDVLDGSGGPALTRQTVVLSNGRISQIGPVATTIVPEHAKQLYLPGHTVIPGLVGMHDHTHMPGQTFLGEVAARLWLASGVTTIQTAGSADFQAELSLTAAIQRGDMPGPTIFPTAPYLTGPDGNGPMHKPETPAQARQLVKDWSAKGATWFKLYRHIQPAIAAAVIDEAHKQGRKVTGHLCSLTFSEAAQMGIDSIEHGLISATDFHPQKSDGQCVSSRQGLAALDIEGEEVAKLIVLLVEKQVTLTSTLAIIESHFAHRPQGEARSLALMSEAWQQAYQRRQRQLKNNASSMPDEVLAKLMAFERRFVQAGGHLVMGPDPGRHVLPGHGNQRGFELLVEAGFSPPQALKIATANAAKTLGQAAQFGQVAIGFNADLVVLKGKLAADARVIRNVELVIKQGQVYDPAKLLEGLQGRFGPQLLQD